MDEIGPTTVKYLNELTVVLISDKIWKLASPFFIQIDDDKLEIPVGFVTDFDSVPKLPVVYLTLAGSGKRASVGHDFLYSNKSPERFKVLGRRWADRFFWAAMIMEGVDYKIADLKYAGVRIGGESHWEF